MRKILVLVFSIIFLFTLTACMDSNTSEFVDEVKTASIERQAAEESLQEPDDHAEDISIQKEESQQKPTEILPEAEPTVNKEEEYTSTAEIITQEPEKTPSDTEQDSVNEEDLGQKDDAVIPSSADVSSKPENDVSTEKSPIQEITNTTPSAPVVVAPIADTQPVVEQKTQPDAAKENVVYVTENGKKYHSTASCSNMKNPIEITLEDALDSGRGPCSKCW